MTAGVTTPRSERYHVQHAPGYGWHVYDLWLDCVKGQGIDRLQAEIIRDRLQAEEWARYAAAGI